MSISQFDLFLVPESYRNLAVGSGDQAIPDISKALLEQARVSLYVSLGKPWHMLKHVEVYGDEKGNRVDVSCDDSGDGEIQARIDARIESIGFCRQVCALAKELDLLLYLPETEQILEPRSTALQFALERSAAAAYVKGS